MSDLVGNPEDRFSHNEAHFISDRIMQSEGQIKIKFYFYLDFQKNWVGSPKNQKINKRLRTYKVFKKTSGLTLIIISSP